METIFAPLPVYYVQISRFEALTGYSEKAVRRKIEEGIWAEGKEYAKAPDGRILINLVGYHKWVQSKR